MADQNGVNNGHINKVRVVLGAQWGDEGKGKLVDLLAENADVVARCQVSKNPAILRNWTIFCDLYSYFIYGLMLLCL